MKKLIVTLTSLLLTFNAAAFDAEKFNQMLNDKAFDAAEEILEAELEKQPNNAELQFYKGNLYSKWINEVNLFSKMSYASKMKKAWMKAIEIDPAHIKARYSLVMFYLNAPAIAGGSNKKAFAQAEQLAQYDPRESMKALIAIHSAENNDTKANELYEQYLKSHHDDYSMLYRYVVSLNNQEMYPKAIALIEETFEKNDDAMDLHTTNGLRYQYGKASAKGGLNFEQAEQQLQTYLVAELDNGLPGKDWANFRLGLIYKQMDKKDLAQQHFDIALKTTLDESLQNAVKREMH